MNIHVGSESCSRTFSCQHVFRNAANLASPGFLLKSSRNCRSSAKNCRSEPRHLQQSRVFPLAKASQHDVRSFFVSEAKSTAPTPLELGRLLEDEGALQARKSSE